MCAANAADHLLPGQSFLGCPAEMERKERGGGHCTRGAPSPSSAPLPSWGTRIMGTQRRRSRSRGAADKAQVKRWGAGAQRSADTQAERGPGGEGTAKAWAGVTRATAAHPVRMWGRAQASCAGKRQNGRPWLWKEEGREIPS